MKNVGKNIRTARSALLKMVTGLAAAGKYAELRRATEALQIVDSLLNDTSLDTIDGLGYEARELAHAGRKIDAIKLVRASSGQVTRDDGSTGYRLGLKDAKDLVEAYMQKHGLESRPYANTSVKMMDRS